MKSELHVQFYLSNSIFLSIWTIIIADMLPDQAVDRFRGNEHSVLVATDVAARGLDIPGIRTVVHYQLPHSAEVGAKLCFWFLYASEP